MSAPVWKTRFALADRRGISIDDVLDMPVWQIRGWLDFYKDPEGAI